MRNAKQTDHLIPLNQAIREEIPGEKNPSTTHRWITRGLAGLNGERIRLQVWYAGRQPCTTRAAVRQFLTDVTAARLARLELSQQRDIDVTEAELTAAGLVANRRQKANPARSGM